MNGCYIRKDNLGLAKELAERLFKYPYEGG